MWGELEQGFTSEVSNHSTQAIHAWHVAVMRFVTLLSKKVLTDTLEKLSCLQRRAFYGVVPDNRAICPTSMHTEYSLARIVLQDLMHF